MLQTDITLLKRRKTILEKQIDDALSHARIDDPMIAHLKSLFYTSMKRLIVCVTKNSFSTIDLWCAVGRASGGLGGALPSAAFDAEWSASLSQHGPRVALM